MGTAAGVMLAVMAVAMLPLLIAVALLVPVRAWRRRRERRSPLTFALAQWPGERCRQLIERHREGIDESLLALTLGGPLLMIALLVRYVDWTRVRFGLFEIAMLVLLVPWIAWYLRRLFRHGRALRQARDGLQAELATAQELAPLQRRGFDVFHHVVLRDASGAPFDIDHVVVGDHAVWTIETKSRRKPRTGGKDSATVRYDGVGLHFPDWREKRVLDQARGQARALRDCLSRHLDTAPDVRPMVSLPGWYVDDRGGARAHAIVPARLTPAAAAAKLRT